MRYFALNLFLFISGFSFSQSPDEILNSVKAKLDQVHDYVAEGKLKTNIAFIKAPVADVKVYYKKPDRLRIVNEKGLSFIPKGSANINLATFLSNSSAYNIVDAGTEAGTGFKILKLLPIDENSEIVLSTVYIDEINKVIRKAKNTTRNNGTYELELFYNKQIRYGLPDKVIFSFNTKDYKLPKGVTLDYDGGSKTDPDGISGNKKGKVEITYSSYVINKGIEDKIFE